MRSKEADLRLRLLVNYEQIVQIWPCREKNKNDQVSCLKHFEVESRAPVCRPGKAKEVLKRDLVSKGLTDKLCITGWHDEVLSGDKG